ncbi:MAG: adenylate cyclase, partial [Actinomycetota bacterium]
MPDPKSAGRAAVHGFRRGVAQRIVETLRERDPEALDGLVEVGVVSRDFVDDPDAGAPVRNAPPLAMIERLLERSIERKPSLMATVGLSAIQLMAGNEDDEEGTAAGASARLTVAFTDLEGFTRFTERNGDDAASRLVADHHRTIGPIVRGRGGRVVKRIGDGLLLTFPEAEAGVLACLELVATPPAPLRLRAGLHVGDVVLTRDDIVGHVVNVAARVTESAKGGEVVVTGDVRAAIEGLPRVEFGRLRRKSFRGLDEQIPVCKASYA